MGFGLAVSAGGVRSRESSKEGPVVIQLKGLRYQKLSVLMRFTTASTAADRPKRSELPYDDTLLPTRLLYHRVMADVALHRPANPAHCHHRPFPETDPGSRTARTWAASWAPVGDRCSAS